MTPAARPATEADAAAIAAIFNEGIADRIATFETDLRTAEEVREWLGGAHPVVVVEEDGAVVGFARSGPTSTRGCYARNAHFSVYVARNSRGRGVGEIAMRALVRRARETGFWKLESGVFPENHASLRLLARVGFRTMGTYEAHGQLDGVWRDVVLVELIVGR